MNKKDQHILSTIKEANRFTIPEKELLGLFKQTFGNDEDAVKQGLNLLKQLGNYFPKKFIRLEHLQWMLENEENLSEITKILEFFEEESGKPFRISARVILESQVKGCFYGPYDAAYFKMLESIYGFEIPVELQPVWIAYYSSECATLRRENENWSDVEIAFEAGSHVYYLAEIGLSEFHPDPGDIADIDNNTILRVIGIGLEAIACPIDEIPEEGWYASGAKKAIKGGNRFNA